jgi:AcrR family transcriptional regulator
MEGKDQLIATRERRDTRQRLIAAAAAEFNARGYDGTDSNRIARRAGFAPQTFYRWFTDKAEIFIEVYNQWHRTEFDALRTLLAKKAPDERLVKACVDHHRAYLRFRRSLRHLSYENARVRQARAEGRLRQIDFLRSLNSQVLNPHQLAAMLLQIERLCDALAEGEFADMGLSEVGARRAVAALIHGLRGDS